MRETPVRGIRVDFNEDAIAAYKRNRIGWFILGTVSVGLFSQAMILRIRSRLWRCIGTRTLLKKCFDDLKNDLDMKRLRIHSSATMEGRIFVQFRAYPEIIRTPLAPRLFRHIASVSLAGRQLACGKPPNLAKNPWHNRRTSNFEIGSYCAANNITS